MSRAARLVMLPAALLLWPALDAPAQAAGAVSIGTRVRVYAPDLREDRYVGRVDSLGSDVMVLDTAGMRTRLGFDMGPVLVDEYRRVAIRLSAIQSLEVSGGRTKSASTIRGAVIGAVIGGVILGLGNLPEVNPSASDFVRGVPAGLLVGGLIGGTIGWGLGGESWRPAAIPPAPSSVHGSCPGETGAPGGSSGQSG